MKTIKPLAAISWLLAMLMLSTGCAQQQGATGPSALETLAGQQLFQRHHLEQNEGALYGG